MVTYNILKDLMLINIFGCLRWFNVNDKFVNKNQIIKSQMFQSLPHKR